MKRVGYMLAIAAILFSCIVGCQDATENPITAAEGLEESLTPGLDLFSLTGQMSTLDVLGGEGTGEARVFQPWLVSAWLRGQRRPAHRLCACICFSF